MSWNYAYTPNELQALELEGLRHYPRWRLALRRLLRPLNKLAYGGRREEPLR